MPPILPWRRHQGGRASSDAAGDCGALETMRERTPLRGNATAGIRPLSQASPPEGRATLPHRHASCSHCARALAVSGPVIINRCFRQGHQASGYRGRPCIEALYPTIWICGTVSCYRRSGIARTGHAARRLPPARAPRAGRPAGWVEIARQLDVPQNTMSAHLATLARAGLVKSERHSRLIVYRADLEVLRELTLFSSDRHRDEPWLSCRCRAARKASTRSTRFACSAAGLRMLTIPMQSSVPKAYRTVR